MPPPQTQPKTVAPNLGGGAAGQAAQPFNIMDAIAGLQQGQAAGANAAQNIAHERNQLTRELVTPRHLGMSGELLDTKNPWDSGFWTPPEQRAGLQDLHPHGDFSLLTPQGRAPSYSPGTIAQGGNPWSQIFSAPQVPVRTTPPTGPAPIRPFGMSNAFV